MVCALVPPAEVNVIVLFGVTVIWMTVEVLLHPPDVTVLLYHVVCVNTPGV